MKFINGEMLCTNYHTALRLGKNLTWKVEKTEKLLRKYHLRSWRFSWRRMKQFESSEFASEKSQTFSDPVIAILTRRGWAVQFWLVLFCNISMSHKCHRNIQKSQGEKLFSGWISFILTWFWPPPNTTIGKTSIPSINALNSLICRKRKWYKYRLHTKDHTLGWVIVVTGFNNWRDVTLSLHSAHGNQVQFFGFRQLSSQIDVQGTINCKQTPILNLFRCVSRGDFSCGTIWHQIWCFQEFLSVQTPWTGTKSSK